MISAAICAPVKWRAVAAPTGQAATQVPQPRQWIAATTARPVAPSSATAPNGHAATHTAAAAAARRVDLRRERLERQPIARDERGEHEPGRGGAVADRLADRARARRGRAGHVDPGEVRGGRLERARAALRHEPALVDLEAQQPRHRHRRSEARAGAWIATSSAIRTSPPSSRTRTPSAQASSARMSSSPARSSTPSAASAAARRPAPGSRSSPPAIAIRASGSCARRRAASFRISTGERPILLGRAGREQHRARRPPARAAHLAAGRAVRVQHPLERVARDDALRPLHLARPHPGRDHDRAGGHLARARRLAEPDRAERARPGAGVADLSRGAQARAGVDDRRRAGARRGMARRSPSGRGRRRGRGERRGTRRCRRRSRGTRPDRRRARRSRSRSRTGRARRGRGAAPRPSAPRRARSGAPRRAPAP